MLEWYKVIILLAQLSCISKAAASFSGVVLSLNSNESSNKYLFANVSVLLIAALCDDNLLHAKYKHTPWKHLLFKYPARTPSL